MKRSSCVCEPNRDEPSGVGIRLPRQPSRVADDDDEIRPWGHAPHRHPHAQFVGAIMGRATITVDDHEFEADGSWGVWIPPLVWHSARFHDRYVPLVHNGGAMHRDQPTAVFVDPDLRHALLTAGHGPGRSESPADAALADALRRARTARDCRARARPAGSPRRSSRPSRPTRPTPAASPTGRCFCTSAASRSAARSTPRSA